MTENKRYFKRMWEEEYYIFDSQQISEKEFDDKVEYEDYKAFADSMMGDEVVDRLNELNDENKELKASLYAEKTNTAEVVNDYAKQFKRHSAQFSFMIDLAEDLGVNIKSLEALDD